MQVLRSRCCHTTGLIKSSLCLELKYIYLYSKLANIRQFVKNVLCFNIWHEIYLQGNKRNSLNTTLKFWDFFSENSYDLQSLKNIFFLYFRLIYKCSMCDTVFTLQSLLNTHFDQHVINHKVSVFKCPDCSTLYAQKQLMLDHIKVGMTRDAVLLNRHWTS